MQALNIIENPRFEGDKSTKIQVVKTTQIGVDGLFLKPGQTHGPHRLPDRDRAFVVVTGKGELVLHTEPVDQRIELTPGMVALAPRNTWHAVVCSGTDNLILAVASEFPARVEERG
jgi:quercetin dioxygenase-like cupin family protein